MTRISTALLASSLFVAAPLAAQSRDTAQARADQQTQPRFEESVEVTGSPVGNPATDHFLTFSEPVSVPGVTLPAGRYIFRFPLERDLAGNTSMPVIQVLKQDSDTYAMFHAIPVRDASRTLATDDYAVTWRERGDEEAPPAIATLFLPRESTGYEFQYDKRD